MSTTPPYSFVEGLLKKSGDPVDRLFHFLRYAFLGLIMAWVSPSVFAVQGLQMPFDYKIDLPASTGQQPDIRRTDFLLIGEVVSIDKEIRTNGGNVWILTDRLIVNAPIDTRVHSSYTKLWDLGSPRNLPDTRYALDAAAPFVSLYTFHDYYDSVSRTYKYRSASLDELEGGTVRIAQMPSALIPTARSELPAWEATPTDGPDAPQNYDRTVFKSGDITIYARNIEFCAECVRTDLHGNRPSNGDPFDEERSRFFYAAGLKGGRGGAGSIFPCAFRSQYHVGPFAQICDAKGVPDMPGGVSGKPGQGGDAGNVRVFIVNNRPFLKQELGHAQRLESLKRCQSNTLAHPGRRCITTLEGGLAHSIAALTDVEGGRPSHLGALHTPSFNALTGAPQGNRDLFTLVTPVTGDISHLYGKPGQLILMEVTAEAALEDFAATVTALDADPKYNLPLIVQQLAHGSAGASPLGRDWVASFLESLLLKRQARLLNELLIPKDVLMRGGQPQQWPADLLSNLRCDPQEVLLLDKLEVELTRRICEFRQVVPAQDAIRGYFALTGGLLRPTTLSAAPEFHYAQLAAELARLNAATTKLTVVANEINSTLYEHATAQVKAEYLKRILNLQEALTQAQQALEKEKDVLGHLVPLGKEAGDEAQRLGGAWDKIASTANPTYESVAAIAAPLFSTVEKTVRLVQAIDGFFGGRLGEEERKAVERIQSELLSVKKELSLFLQEVADAKAQLLADKNAGLREYLDARHRVVSSRRQFLFDFEHMLRAAVLLYASDPSQNKLDFDTAVRTQLDVLLNFPNQKLSALPRQADTRCPSTALPALRSVPRHKPISCVTVSSSGKAFTLLSGSGSRLPNFPLLSVGDHIGTYSVNFQRLVSREELQTALIRAQEAAPLTPVKELRHIDDPTEPISAQ